MGRRLAFYLVTAWAALTINFFLPRLMPGSPIDAALNRLHGTASPAVIAALKAQYGLNTRASLLSQYWHYWDQLFHGNLGTSTSEYPAKVVTVIGQTLPWTLGLVGLASVISFVIGTLLGIFVAWRRGTIADAILPVTTFFSAIPYFWLGLVLITVFGIKLHWLPFIGGYRQGLTAGFNSAYITSVVTHGILPAVTIVLASMAGWLVGMRNMMITTLNEDYVLVARAKGLSNRRVVFTYAARNAILPNLAGFALALGFVVAGSLLTEIVFSYPGIGTTLLNAVTGDDYPLMQGIFLVITVVVLCANFLADMVYVLLDPRTRQEA
jgi:peptide/nickel transport system permease protein